MTHSHCKRHDSFVMEGDHCPSCFREWPEDVRRMATRSKRWDKAYMWFGGLSAVAVALVVVIFRLVREWFIWVR